MKIRSIFQAVIQTSALLLAGVAVQAQPAAPTVTLGPPSRIPVPAGAGHYYANDSAAPYLPTANGSTNMTFWVGGAAYRSTGPALDAMGPINPTTAVLSAGPSGTFDGNGAWLINAIRQPNGNLIGVYHAEDHTFTNAGYGEWNSTGLAISSDDGLTWVKQGQIIASQKPATPAYGGIEATCVFYNPSTSKWIGIGHGCGFASSDPNAAPGTWKGWYNGAFTTSMSPVSASPALSTLPGLSSNMMACKVHWNTYLNQWVMVWQAFGSKDIKICASSDGINWGPSALLLTADSAYTYSQIIGVSDVSVGQDGLLVYAENTTDSNDRYRDMVERWVHFGPLTSPPAPTALSASTSTQATQIALTWKGVSQAQSYDVLRSTSATGTFSVIGNVTSSATYLTFLDTSVTPQVTYYYKVQANNTAGTSATSNTASASATYFRLYNRNSSLALDVSGASTTAGTSLVQATDSSGNDQQWQIVNLDGTYFQFVNRNSGLVADVSGASTSNGAQILQWTNSQATNQQWKMVKAGNYYELVNRNSGEVMDVTGASLAPGTKVVQWPNYHAANQQWQIIPSP